MQLVLNYTCNCKLSKLNNSWRNLRNHESCNFILNCTGFPLLSGKSWLLFSILYRMELLWNILRENIGLNLCKYNQLMSWKLRLVEYFFMTYIKCSIKWPTWRWTTASSLLLAGYFSHVSKVNITQQHHCFSVWDWVAGTTSPPPGYTGDLVTVTANVAHQLKSRHFFVSGKSHSVTGMLQVARLDLIFN